MYFSPNVSVIRLIEYIRSCQNEENGGFGGGPGQLPHIVNTYAAICTLVIIGTKEAAEAINRGALKKFIQSLKNEDGSFAVHVNGEVDMRGIYCAVSSAWMAGIATDEDVVGKEELFKGTGEYIAS